MDLVALNKALRTFARRHYVKFDRLSKSETQALEIAALALAVEHYRRLGYDVASANLVNKKFKLKLGAPGHPWNFSHYVVSRGDACFEIHANLSVKSATVHDNGTYVVDVGIADAGQVPASKPTKKDRERWAGLENNYLRTFIEAKKLVIYPMLLAQFVGIVHEIKPEFLSGEAHDPEPHWHLFPALVSIGYLSGTSADIVRGFEKRGFLLNIVPRFDARASWLSNNDDAPSPFVPFASPEEGAGVQASAPLGLSEDDVPF